MRPVPKTLGMVKGTPPVNIESSLDVLTELLGRIEDEGYWLEFKQTPSHSEIWLHSTQSGRGREPDYLITDDDEMTENGDWLYFKTEVPADTS